MGAGGVGKFRQEDKTGVPGTLTETQYFIELNAKRHKGTSFVLVYRETHMHKFTLFIKTESTGFIRNL